jgi:hypothetical protein
MARPCDPRLEAAIAAVASDVEWDGVDAWRLAPVGGSVATITARATSSWLQLTTALAAGTDPPADAWALRLNSWLVGAARLARGRFDEVPHLRADVPLDAADELADALASACWDLAHARQLAHTGGYGLPRTQWLPLPEGSRDIVTRTVSCHARLEANGGRMRAVVELSDLAGYTRGGLRAVSKLLLALGAALPAVVPALHERGDGLAAIVASPMRTATDTGIARALAALGAACDVSLREVAALRQDELAEAYLALAAPTSSHIQEEQPCMQP